MRIVDADAHVNPTPDFWAEYLPAQFRGLAPRIEHDDECDYVVFEGRRRKVNLLGAQDGRSGKDFKITGRYSDMRAGNWMPAARLEDMDRDNIDAAVLFGGGPLGTANLDLFLASFDAYNTWLADFCATEPSRFAGVGYVPMLDVGQSVEMVKEFARRGLKAVNIPAFPNSLEVLRNGGAGAVQSLALMGDPAGPRMYSHPEFDPFWQAVCDLDIPVTIHLGGRRVRIDQMEHYLTDLVMSKLAMAEPISVLVFGQVFERFPALKFVTVESGAGWLAFVADYMDRTWEKQRFWVKNELKDYPSTYMDRNVYASFIHDSIGIATRHLPGAGNIMWSSDYPHSETTYPHSADMIERLMGKIGENDRAEIVGGRAARVFGI